MATEGLSGLFFAPPGRSGLEVVLHRRLVVDDRDRAVPAGAERVLRSGVRVAAHAADVLGVAARARVRSRNRGTLADLVQRPGVVGIDDAHGAVGRHARVPGCRQDAARGGARGGHASAARSCWSRPRRLFPARRNPATPRPPVPVPVPPVPVPPVPMPPVPVVPMPPVPVRAARASAGATRARRSGAACAAAAGAGGPASAGRRAAAAGPRSGPSRREGRAGYGRRANQQRKRKNKATLLHLDLLR